MIGRPNAPAAAVDDTLQTFIAAAGVPEVDVPDTLRPLREQYVDSVDRLARLADESDLKILTSLSLQPTISTCSSPSGRLPCSGYPKRSS